MPYLSREDIDRFAERIIHLYKQTEYPKGHLYYNVDPTRLAEIYDFRIECVNITRDGSILGQTSSCKMWTPIVDSQMNDILFYLDVCKQNSAMGVRNVIADLVRWVFSQICADKVSQNKSL